MPAAHDGAQAVSAAPLSSVILAGGLAGLATDLLVHPLDTARTRLMHRTAWYTGLGDALLGIARTEGVRGLYRGAVITWSLTMPAHAFYFSAYTFTKRLLGGRDGDEGGLVHFSAGCIAECAGSVIWTPLDVIKQRQMVKPERLTVLIASVYKAEVRLRLLVQGVRACVRSQP